MSQIVLQSLPCGGSLIEYAGQFDGAYGLPMRGGCVTMKIAIIGSSGSGKSTFTRELGRLVDLPIHYLDLYYWQPGWVPTPVEEFAALNRRLVAEDAWIIDGLYGKTLDIRLQAADVVVFFDLSPWVTTYRVIKRRIQYHGKTRVDMNEGCPESIDWPFIKLGWNFRRDKRPGILVKLSNHAEHTKIIVIKRPREARRILDLVKASGISYFEHDPLTASPVSQASEEHDPASSEYPPSDPR